MRKQSQRRSGPCSPWFPAVLFLGDHTWSCTRKQAAFPSRPTRNLDFLQRPLMPTFIHVAALLPISKGRGLSGRGEHGPRHRQKLTSQLACLLLQAKMPHSSADALSPVKTLVLGELVKVWKLCSDVVGVTDTWANKFFLGLQEAGKNGET